MTEERSQYFYRFVDRRYSVSNEYGDHAYTSYRVACGVYPVIKYTKCGAWIAMYWTEYPHLPTPYKPTGQYIIDDRKFVNLGATKRFALPTLEEAVESYRARKAKQIRIYSARIKGAEEHLDALNTFLNRQTVLLGD